MTNPASEVAKRERLIAIGASAGGPGALAHLLGALPADFPAAVVIVQHFDAHFTAGMVEWLSRSSILRVRIARDGERPAAGTVLLAGSNMHLVLKSPELLGYSDEPRNHAHRPSVDVLFQSISQHRCADAIGVLLTGMGRDGAAGLKAMRDSGCYTIAQDEATSAVYGMPKAAASLGAAVDILPLRLIAPKLLDALRSPEWAGRLPSRNPQ
jgi:two-component system, chemotaxis family, response regulator WspF